MKNEANKSVADRRDKFMQQYFRPLIGKKVEMIVRDDSDSEFFAGPMYGLQFEGGIIAWIMTDEEGNGPGHLEIQFPHSHANKS